MLKELERSERGGAERDTPQGETSPFLTLREIWQFVCTYRASILLISIVPLLAALAYVMNTPPTYTASAQVLLDPKTPETMRPNLTSGSSFDSPYIESQVALFKSESLALEVIRKNNLMVDPEFLAQLGPDEPAEGPSEEFLRKRQVMLGFEEKLDVRRLGLSYAILVSFSSTDPVKAATLANDVAEAFIRDQLESRAAILRTGSKWLEERIDELRRKMNEAALDVQRFRVRRDYRIAKAPEGGEAGPAEAAQKAASASPSETLEELEATAQTYRRIYESYLQAYTEALQRQSFPVVNARVITPATRPLSPSAPKTKLIVAFGLLLGLLLGFGQAILRYHLASLPRSST